MNPLLAKLRAEAEAKRAANATVQQPVNTPIQQPQQPAKVTGNTLADRLKAQREAISKSTGLIGQANVIGTVASQKLEVNELTSKAPVSKVLTAQQSATEQAQALIRKRAEEGFYSIEKADQLPPELPAAIVEQKLLDLDAALLARTPELTTLCVQINQNLRQYEELAYLLNDEQLHLIVESNLAASNTMISSGKAVDKTKQANLNQKIDNLSLDDFM